MSVLFSGLTLMLSLFSDRTLFLLVGNGLLIVPGLLWNTHNFQWVNVVKMHLYRLWRAFNV